ncbi:MAG TPA: ATP-binding protein [Acidobacteriaceae bacterium]|nr:ATP-binding protein [Acidobacteriaceae bacterium]
MKTPNVSYFNIGPRLAIIFAFLLLLILGGNGLLLWQFHLARVQTELLTTANQQVISVLRLQEALVSTHERLDELVKTRNSSGMLQEAEPLRRALVERTENTRNALTRLPSSAALDPASLSTLLDAIEITLPSQLDAVKALAVSGDWEAIRLRLDHEFEPLETQTATLVANIDREVSGELREAVANMRALQVRILFLVPATAISTFLMAAFLAWAISQRIIELRLEERILERTRIARELHDTLLQGFISASMHVHIAMERLPDGSPAKAPLTRALQVTEQVIEQGRNTVRGFRATEGELQDLERALARVPEDLGFEDQADFRMIVDGSPLPLHPVIRDEVYSIAREALVNAFRHSGAASINVALHYSPNQLHTVVSDNGCGIDHQVLETGRDGHWGLPGMRERARRIGGALKVSSRKGAGTEVDLRVPGDIAYGSQKSAPRRSGETAHRIATNEPLH